MSKLTEFRQKIEEKGIDSALILDEINQRYLCDFAFQDGYLFITRKNAYLVTDFRYYEAALRERSPEFEVLMHKSTTDTLATLIADNGVKSIGFEGNFLPYSRYLAYAKKYSDVELLDIGNVIESLREIKTEREIEKMQKAQDITDAAFSHLLTHIR